MFELLVEHGVVISSAIENDESVAGMLQRRRDWIDQAAAITHRWDVPLTAMRLIHEYVVGFNWAAVYEALHVPLSLVGNARRRRGAF